MSDWKGDDCYKVKILRHKSLFKKQNGKRKIIHNMWTNGFIQTFHLQLVLNGPYLTQCWRRRTTRFVIWEVFYFTDDIMKSICEESIRYAISKGNHSLTIVLNHSFNLPLPLLLPRPIIIQILVSTVYFKNISVCFSVVLPLLLLKSPWDALHLFTWLGYGWQ